uniref:Uncharacterized protein n=1 Tax=Nelumbo nucifera TaxID=4432 RepID=A0A822YNF9_NELNU|nr:TPA_asm: hypothetical protein HUJ06_011267 [Nelumbo nucifera]
MYMGFCDLDLLYLDFCRLKHFSPPYFAERRLIPSLICEDHNGDLEIGFHGFFPQK